MVLSNLKKGYSKYMITDVPFIQTKTKLHALKNCFYATPTVIVWFQGFVKGLIQYLR